MRKPLLLFEIKIESKDSEQSLKPQNRKPKYSITQLTWYISSASITHSNKKETNNLESYNIIFW